MSPCATPRTVAHQAPLSKGFPRQESWSGLPYPSPGIFPNQGSNPGPLHCRQILYHLSHQGSPIAHVTLQTISSCLSLTRAAAQWDSDSLRFGSFLCQEPCWPQPGLQLALAVSDAHRLPIDCCPFPARWVGDPSPICSLTSAPKHLDCDHVSRADGAFPDTPRASRQFRFGQAASVSILSCIYF